MADVRLYGPTIGDGSLVRVTAGMKLGLESLGRLAGFVPIDRDDDDAAYPGYDAPIGVYTGPASHAGIVSSGWHRQRWALLSPNSTWIPRSLLKSMTKVTTGLVTPSLWGVRMIRENLREVGEPDFPVSVWPHAVERTFQPSPEKHALRATEYGNGAYFKVLHLASTTLQRKGTREMLQAWCRLVDAGKLGKSPTLCVIVDGSAEAFRDAFAPEKHPEVVFPGRLCLPPEKAAFLYQQAHVVCQPSRGEAFGQIPLEARACGVVVCATACTGQGHVKWAVGEAYGGEPPGVVVIPTGPDAPIDDGPGAMAPSLSVDDVEAALLRCYEEWPELALQARGQAPGVSAAWSWEERTEQWLKAYASWTTQ